MSFGLLSQAGCRVARSTVPGSRQANRFPAGEIAGRETADRTRRLRSQLGSISRRTGFHFFCSRNRLPGEKRRDARYGHVRHFHEPGRLPCSAIAPLRPAAASVGFQESSSAPLSTRIDSLRLSSIDRDFSSCITDGYCHFSGNHHAAPRLACKSKDRSWGMHLEITGRRTLPVIHERIVWN